MTYMPIDSEPACNFRKCLAGLGLAGMGTCFLKGDWADPNCPKFEDEAQWVKEREKEAKGVEK